MNRSERASQIWTVLAWAASHRQSLTYSQVGKLIGVPTAGLGQLLEPIQSYCLENNLPPLTVLVVQQESGMPEWHLLKRFSAAPSLARSAGEGWGGGKIYRPHPSLPPQAREGTLSKCHSA